MIQNNQNNYEFPSFTMSIEQIGKGWKLVNRGELLKSYHQFYNLAKGKWMISSFKNSEKKENIGRAYYRKPASVNSWIIVLWQMARKKSS